MGAILFVCLFVCLFVVVDLTFYVFGYRYVELPLPGTERVATQLIYSLHLGAQ